MGNNVTGINDNVRDQFSSVLFSSSAAKTPMTNVNVSVNVEFKVTLHEQVRCRGTLQY